MGIAIVSLTVNVVVRGGDAAAHHHDSRGQGFAAPAAAGAAAAEPLAAGEAPGVGVGDAGFGSGALDCVNTIDVTVRSGVAFC